MRFYDVIYHAMPKAYRDWIKNYLNYSEFTISPEKYVGFSLIYGLLLGASVAFSVYILGISVLSFSVKQLAFISGLSSFLLFEVFMHSLLLVISDKIANFTDEILPDVLRLISANIRSGLTPDQALLLSARPEFGPLEKQIINSAKLSFSGKPIEEAIQTISTNINSRAIKRSIELLVEGMASGGSLTNLLDGLSDDIRQTKILKKEVQACVMMYAIFIFFAAGIGAPLLYGISSFLVEMMKNIGGSINVQQSFTGGMKLMSFQNINISINFLILYSLSAIGVTSLFGGILMGLIQEGTEKAGLKYVPILFLISIGIFFVVRIIVASVFGSIV
jgi:flagellar protein FlaJ